MQAFQWTPARSLSNDTASQLILAQFPSLAPARVTAWYEGWDNEAFEINGEWIFRFLKRPDGERPLKREIALLSRLSAVLPVRAPDYQWIGQGGSSFPYVFAGYRKLDGTPAINLSVDLAGALTLARALGSFLSAVHSLAPLDALELGIPHAERDPRIAAAEALDELAELDAEVINLCRAYLEDQIRANQRRSGTPRLLHGDFSAEHILLLPESRRVMGVIDWTDVEIGDPAFDFGYLWVWQGEPLVQEVIRHYRGDVDHGFLERVRLVGVCSAIADAHYGVMAGIDKNRRIGVVALERSFLRRL